MSKIVKLSYDEERKTYFPYINPKPFPDGSRDLFILLPEEVTITTEVPGVGQKSLINVGDKIKLSLKSTDALYRVPFEFLKEEGWFVGNVITGTNQGVIRFPISGDDIIDQIEFDERKQIATYQ